MLLVRFERVLGHRVKCILQSFVIGQKILVVSRVDVLDACYHGVECALEGVLVVTAKEVKFVVTGGGRGRQDVAETRWGRHRSSWERRRIDGSVNERIRRRAVALGRVSTVRGLRRRSRGWCVDSKALWKEILTLQVVVIERALKTR